MDQKQPKQKKDFLGRYQRVLPVAKVLRPACTVLFYVTAVLLAVLLLVMVIVIFINVDTNEMLLPPEMSALRDDADVITAYHLRLGNGLQLTADAALVTLMHIKTVIWCRLGSWCIALLMLVPALKFSAALLGNIARGDALSARNARYIGYIGLTVAIGNTFWNIFHNLFNFIQVRQFLGETVGYDFGINVFGIVVGLFILLIGAIYGYACAQSSAPASSVPVPAVPEDKEETL